MTASSPLPSYLYVPNMIGYARVIAMLLSFAYAQENWKFTCFCYLLSQALDAVDGFAARGLNQCSELGAVLDMVTDRVSTTGLCVVLAQIYPQYLGAFCALICLDMFSHWYQMYATLASGGTSHKKNTNWILKLYYNRPILFTVCAGNELFFVSMYALHFGGGPMLPLPPTMQPMAFFRAVGFCAAPFFVFKQFTNVVQLLTACGTIVEIDAKRAKASGAVASKRAL